MFFRKGKIRRKNLTLCTRMSRRQFLSQQLLCRVPRFFAKEEQNSILEIVSRCIIHLKIRKYNNSVNKTGI